MKIMIIIIYIILLFLVYIAIYKRLTFLNDGHISHIWCKYLKKRKRILVFGIGLVLLVLGFSTSILIFTLL